MSKLSLLSGRKKTGIVVASVAGAAIVLPALMASTASAASVSTWDRVAACESGGNWAVNTGNGYYGGYQFDQRTWRGLGYKGRPDRAEPRFQDAATIKLHNKRGWAPWPACSRKEHLH